MMFQEPVLQARSLGKLYARSTSQTRSRIGEDIWRATLGMKPSPKTSLGSCEFWALKDIDLELKRGEALGIIGLNGSGKTTLLRILAGQIVPDAGHVQISGRTASMIDLTAGFQTSQSGRQNIVLRGSALGRSQAEIEASMDQIIDFAELEDAIDAPVATYSSGMTMRLAFSIMIASVPDILFIDEVLAVGDFRFRQKCLGRLREIRETTSFVMVSHSMHTIARFCDHAIVLHKGRLAFEGDSEAAITFYNRIEQGEDIEEHKRANILPGNASQEDKISNIEFHWAHPIEENIVQLNESGEINIKCCFDLLYNPTNLVVGIALYTQDGDNITAFSTEQSGCLKQAKAGSFALNLHIPAMMLNAGRYRTAVGITDGEEFLYLNELPDIAVRPSGRLNWGYITIPYKWDNEV